MRSRVDVRRRLCFAFIAGILLVGTIATPALAAPDFQITVNPESQSLSPGTSVSFVVGIGSIDGFSDPVDLSVSGLPPSVTAFFSPNPVTPPGTSFLTLTASEDAEDGTFPLTITATGGGITHVADGQATVDFGLIPVCYGAFEGNVTDRETGLPIAGVRVWNTPEGLTDDAGHYRIEHLALGQNNSPTEYFFRATKEPEYWWSDRQGILFCDQTTTLDFTMVRIRPARVSGTVVEGIVIPPDYDTVIPTSTPIEGARVCVFDFLCQLSPTGPDGAFDITFNVGHDNEPLDAYLTANTFDMPWRTGYWWTFDPMGTVGPDDHVTQDIAMVKMCTVSISGNAVYGDTGEPAANVGVQAALGGIELVDTTTDDQGAFSIPEILLGPNNAPGTYIVGSTDGSGAFTTVSLDECGEHGVAATLVLDRPRSATIEGFVFDEETLAPIEGASVSWCRFSCPYVLTNATGHYQLEIPLGFSDDPRDFSVIADKAGYWGPEQDPVVEDLLPNQNRSAPDIFLLLRHYASLTGVVRDAITHEPIPGAGVIAQDGQTQGTNTDAEGRYEIDGIQLAFRNAPWEPTVSAFADGYWPNEATVEVRADEQAVLDLDLLPICTDATISGRVVNAVTLEPIEGADVFGNGFGTRTDANGEYLIENVRVGVDNQPLQVQLTAFAPEFHSQTKRITVFCGASISLNFGPEEPTSAINGYVTDVTNGSPGEPMPGVLVGGGFGETTTTDENGFYEFPEVPLNADGSPRTWDVTAFPAGFASKTDFVEVHADEVARLDFTFSGEAPSTGTIVVRKDTVPDGDPSTFDFTGDAEGTIADGGEIRVADLAPGEYHVSEVAADGWILTGIECDDAQSETPSLGDLDAATAVFGLDAGETVTCTFTNSTRADHLTLDVKAGRNVSYSIDATLTSGDYDVNPATGSPSSIVGTGTIPSASGTGTATVTFDLVFDAATKRWSGTVIVNDPGEGFSATVAVAAGRRAITRTGTVTGGVLKGLRALSEPRMAFSVVFEIDDLA